MNVRNEDGLVFAWRLLHLSLGNRKSDCAFSELLNVELASKLCGICAIVTMNEKIGSKASAEEFGLNLTRLLT